MSGAEFDREFSEKLGQRVSQALSEGPSRERMLAQRARLIEWEQRRGTSSSLLPTWLLPAAMFPNGLFSLSGVSAEGGGRPARHWISALVGVCAVTAVALGIWIISGPLGAVRPQLEAQMAGQPLSTDAWITSSAADAELRFSDGSEIALGAGGRARLLELDRDGARLALESGRVDVSIVPETGYRWTIQAGPYRVSVLGTVFSVSWSPEHERIEVRVARGRVQFDGGQQREAQRVLVAGDTVVATPTGVRVTVGADPGLAVPSLAKLERMEPPLQRPDDLDALGSNRLPDTGSAAGEAELEPPPSTAVSKGEGSLNPEPLTDSPSPVPDAEHGRPARLDTVGGDPVRDKAAGVDVERGDALDVDAVQGDAAESWKHLAREARYAEAVRVANRVGTAGLLASSSVSDLLLLADAARLSGGVALARDALLTLRKRFPSHPNATTAAFSLGRLAYEVQHDDREAVRWFRIYLRSAPTGPLAEGARGRLLMALHRLGDKTSARKAARDYLAHHPSGRHGNVARSLLDD